MNTNMGLLGRKLGMTQIYDEAGTSVPVTAIEAGPCTVLQVKTRQSDGYDAIQIGFEDAAPRNVPEEVLRRAQGARARYRAVYGRASRPEQGHCFKAKETPPQRFVRELRLAPEEVAGFEPGQKVTLDIFSKGGYVDVVGTSKGRGFTGVVKRHGFSMFPRSHGAHEWTRHGGSIGCRKPMHVRKGQRMAGQHGNSRVTVQNLKIAGALPEQNVLLVRGAVPGPNGGYLIVRTALKKR